MLVWGKANENNRKSKFSEAFQQLKEKQVKFPSELRYFAARSKPAKEQDLSKSIVHSPAAGNADTIFTLMEKYDEIRLYTKE